MIPSTSSDLTYFSVVKDAIEFSYKIEFALNEKLMDTVECVEGLLCSCSENSFKAAAVESSSPEQSRSIHANCNATENQNAAKFDYSAIFEEQLQCLPNPNEVSHVKPTKTGKDLNSSVSKAEIKMNFDSKSTSKPRATKARSTNAKKAFQKAFQKQFKEECLGHSNEEVVPTDNDVLFGRGGRANHHVGNHRFLHIKKLMEPRYRNASKEEKKVVSKELVDAVHAMGGRFLVREDGKWYIASLEAAQKKASQALRDTHHVEHYKEKRNKYCR